MPNWLQQFLDRMNSYTPSRGSIDYLNSFSPEDQAAIRQSWVDSRLPAPGSYSGPFAGVVSGAQQRARDLRQNQMQNEWYNNAMNAGAVPAAPVANPNLVSATLNAFGGNAPSSRPAPMAAQVSTAVRRPQPGWTPQVPQPQPQSPQPQQPSYSSQFSDPYEEWKAQGRPGGTFAAWKASQGI